MALTLVYVSESPLGGKIFFEGVVNFKDKQEFAEFLIDNLLDNLGEADGFIIFDNGVEVVPDAMSVEDTAKWLLDTLKAEEIPF